MPAKVSRLGNDHGSEKPDQRDLAILRLIHSGSNYSRLDLARKTGLSPALITSIVRNLIGLKLVNEAPAVSSLVGRKPIPLEVRADAGYLIGVDIGSFYSHVVIADMKGQVIRREQIETGIPDGRVRVLQRVFDCVHQTIAASKVNREAILGMGVAHSGVIDTEKGLVLSFPRPGQMAQWKNVPLQAIFEDEFHLPCLLEDSVRTMATAERHFGLGREVDDFLFIEVGMGIGAAIFVEGKLYRGGGGKAGEFGHITVDENGPLCSCGNNGCLEACASATAVVNAAERIIAAGKAPGLAALKSTGTSLSAQVLAKAALDGDLDAKEIYAQTGRALGICLAGLINILNLPLYVVGGGMANSWDLLSKSLFEELERRSYVYALTAQGRPAANGMPCGGTRVLPARLGAEAGLLGACILPLYSSDTA